MASTLLSHSTNWSVFWLPLGSVLPHIQFWKCVYYSKGFYLLLYFSKADLPRPILNFSYWYCHFGKKRPKKRRVFLLFTIFIFKLLNDDVYLSYAIKKYGLIPTLALTERLLFFRDTIDTNMNYLSRFCICIGRYST